MNLGAIFGNLVDHVVMRAGESLPPARPGISWIWGANGIFKRGVDAHRDLMIRAGDAPRVPGLAQLQPHAHLFGAPGPVPTTILEHVLLHARCLGRCEQQYFITVNGDTFEVLLPPQEATAGRVSYTLPANALIDLHSHHEMRAYFSETDDRDDMGLSISGVIGCLDTDRPEIVVRANVYGLRQIIPMDSIFAGRGLFHERHYADAHD